MRKFLTSLKRLFLDGILLAIPLAFLGFLAAEALKSMREVIRPLVGKLPVDSVLGIGALTVATILALVLTVMLFGLVVRWGERRAVDWLEAKVLKRIPLYQMLKMISDDVVVEGAEQHAVLVDLYGTGSSSLGIQIEGLPSGDAVVFVPNSPSATTGAVHIVPHERLRVLDAKTHEVMEVLSNRGLGATGLFGTPDPSPDVAED